MYATPRLTKAFHSAGRALLLCSALLATTALAAAPEGRKERVPKVQIALLLDNSGSMGGLLNQARTQLWSVVNEFAKARQHGKPIRLEIALFEYGEQVKLLSPLTTNLDAISEKLFALGIRGGEEYCGQVIQSAVRQLEWSGDADDLKLIYIAGNEPFTQGPVDYRSAIGEAKEKGITVNTIHCGGPEAGWQAAALAAGGNFLMINQNAQVATVTAPQDAELARLGSQLNRTYVGYGRGGEEARTRQEKMDTLAAQAAPAAAAERAVAKGSRNYRNAEWDLVDAMKDGTVKVESLRDDQLPAELKGKSAGEREAYVKAKAKEREELQAKIAKLSEERKQHLAKQQKESAPTLDSELAESVQSLGAAKAFSF